MEDIRNFTRKSIFFYLQTVKIVSVIYFSDQNLHFCVPSRILCLATYPCKCTQYKHKSVQRFSHIYRRLVNRITRNIGNKNGKQPYDGMTSINIFVSQDYLANPFSFPLLPTFLHRKKFVEFLVMLDICMHLTHIPYK